MYTNFQNQLRNKLANINNINTFNTQETIINREAIFTLGNQTFYNFRSPYYLNIPPNNSQKGTIPQLETSIATLLSAESCILYNSITDAYCAIVTHLLNRNDAIIYDSPSTFSILGCAANCKPTKYKAHNTNIEDIEKQLKLSQAQQNRLLVIDAVNITSGNIAPLNQIFALTTKYNAIVAIDETHSAGIIGHNGQGVTELFGLEGISEISIGALNKSFGTNSGAYIAGRTEIIDWLRQQITPITSTTALPQSDIDTALSAITTLTTNEPDRKYLSQITNYFIKKLYCLGFEILPTQTPIFAIAFDDNQTAELFAQQLQKNNILVSCLSNPYVGKNSARIILQMSAKHSQKDIEIATELFKKAANAIKLFK